MGQILTNLIVLKAALSNGLFLRDSSGTNQVIINSNGTATRDLLADGQFTTTGNAVIGASASVLTNKILGNGANEVTIDDNLKVAGALSCDGNPQAANMEATSSLNVQGSLSVSGSMPSPFWCVGTVQNGSVLTTGGRHGFQVALVASGEYLITFDAAHPTTNPIVTLSEIVPSSNLYLAAPVTSTGFTVYARTLNFQITTANFSFMVLV
jgi:hypothetical protein